MIAKGRSISHLRASINYALSKEAAIVLDKNIVAATPTEVAKEFKLFQDFNERCERNSFSFIISPTVEDRLAGPFEEKVTLTTQNPLSPVIRRVL